MRYLAMICAGSPTLSGYDIKRKEYKKLELSFSGLHDGLYKLLGNTIHVVFSEKDSRLGDIFQILYSGRVSSPVKFSKESEPLLDSPLFYVENGRKSQKMLDSFLEKTQELSYTSIILCYDNVVRDFLYQLRWRFGFRVVNQQKIQIHSSLRTGMLVLIDTKYKKIELHIVKCYVEKKEKRQKTLSHNASLHSQ